QKDPIKTLCEVFVHDLCDPVQACLGGGHQRSDSILSQIPSGQSDSFYRLLITVVAGPGAIGVVQIPWTVQRSRQMDLVLLTQLQDLWINQRQVGRDNKGKFFAGIAFFRFEHYSLDERKVE